MKRLSISLAAIMLLFALSGNSITTTPATVSDAQTLTPHAAPANLTLMYYWYSVPDDWYDGHKTTSDEIDELWMWYGSRVDTNPGGGTLIAKGYLNNSHPHDSFASQYLYVHY
jgi:hypothetical protein